MNLRSFVFIAVLSTSACFDMGRDEEPVDPFRELEIVDEDVTFDVRARNAGAGPWSFRHLAVEAAGGAEDVAARVVERGLAGSPAFSDVLEGWPRSRAGGLDLARAPMRLIAISNRIDLGAAADAVSPSGEGRFVFAMTRGPGDDPSSEATPATVILEYALPSVKSPLEWAAAWHALGRIDDRDEYRRELERVTRSFTERGAGDGGSALAQVRASKRSGDGHVALYELAFDGTGDLSRRGLRNTPRSEVVLDADFQAWARAHEVEIRDGRHVLPSAFRADVVDTGRPPVLIADISDDTQRAFDAATCDGCHRAGHGATDGGFHVSPFRRGRERLSRFVHDTANREDDDLARRERDLRARLLSE